MAYSQTNINDAADLSKLCDPGGSYPRFTRSQIARLLGISRYRAARAIELLTKTRDPRLNPFLVLFDGYDWTYGFTDDRNDFIWTPAWHAQYLAERSATTRDTLEHGLATRASLSGQLTRRDRRIINAQHVIVAVTQRHLANVAAELEALIP